MGVVVVVVVGGTQLSLNIAEGTGRVDRDQGRFYGFARGSALECAAILDALVAMKLLDEAAVEEEMMLLSRSVAMLTKMV